MEFQAWPGLHEPGFACLTYVLWPIGGWLPLRLDGASQDWAYDDPPSFSCLPHHIVGLEGLGAAVMAWGSGWPFGEVCIA